MESSEHLPQGKVHSRHLQQMRAGTGKPQTQRSANIREQLYADPLDSTSAPSSPDRVENSVEDKAKNRENPYRFSFAIENDNKLFGLWYFISGGRDGSDFGRTHGVDFQLSKTLRSGLSLHLLANSTLFTQRNGMDVLRRDSSGNVLYRDAEGRRGGLQENVWVNARGQRVDASQLSIDANGNAQDQNGNPVQNLSQAYFDEEGNRVLVDPATAAALIDPKNVGIFFNEVTEVTLAMDDRQRPAPWYWRASLGFTVLNREHVSVGGTGQQIAFHRFRNVALPGEFREYKHFPDGGGVRWGMIGEGGGGFDYPLYESKSLDLSYVSEGRFRLNYVPDTVGFAGTYMGLNMGLSLALGKRDAAGDPIFQLDATQDTRFYPDSREAELITRATATLYFYYADVFLGLNLYRGSPINDYYVYNANNSTMVFGIRGKIGR